MMDFAASTDASLWKQATIGKSDEACCALIDRHKAMVWGVCSQLLLCRNDVEEAYQVTFLALLENGENIRSADFGPWLYRVAHRAALRVRSDSLHKTPQPAHEIPENIEETAFDQIEQAEQSQLIGAAIDSLPQKQREVLILHYIRGMTREEVANLLKTTVQAVKGRLSQARSALRSRLVRHGISLSLVTLLLTRQAEATVCKKAASRTLECLKHWLAGKAVPLGKVHFSDLNKKDVGMVYRNALNSKSLTAVLLTLTILTAFFTGSLTSAQSGQLNLNDERTECSPQLVSSIPATTNDRDIAQNDFGTSNPSVLLVSSPRPAPAAGVANPNQIASTAVSQSGRNSKDSTHTGHSGLPEGTWIRELPFGKITARVKGKTIDLNLPGAGKELTGLVFDIKAEYSVASDGTIYGLILAADVGGWDESALNVGGTAVAVVLFESMLQDMPFSMGMYADGDSVHIKNFTLGYPRNAELSEVLSNSDLQEALSGSYTKQNSGLEEGG